MSIEILHVTDETLRAIKENMALALIEATDMPLPATIAAMCDALVEARALADHAERRHWHDGEPPKPQRDEWFIAETIYGARVCLKALPEDWAYDYTTTDETYIMARNIKRWMRFPDSHFIEPAPNAALKAAAPPIRAGAAETDAARDVLAERQRQISAEGWTPEHDDAHEEGSLACAAGCYAIHASLPDAARVPKVWAPQDWPWGAEWWKPKDRRSDLVRAGALILAEIERLDRALKGEQP
jgi:hypothetical protein